MNAPQPITPTPVGPGEATAGTFVAGMLGYITAFVAHKYSLDPEMVAGALSLVSAAAMAVWHQVKK